MDESTLRRGRAAIGQRSGREARARARRALLATLERCEDRTLLATVFAADGANNLIVFDSASPSTIDTRAITGLGMGETVVGIDFRPATGDLYALTIDAGSVGRLYTIDPNSATTTSSVDLDTALSGTSFGVDFNPVPDRLRVTSDTGQNLRINVDTGVTITDGAINPGTPTVVAVAYRNNFAGTLGTTLYTIDSVSDQLSIQNPPNNGTQAPVGPLGVDVDALAGFDILSTGDRGFSTQTPLAALTVAGTTSLYSIDLTTGAATLVGPIGAGTTSLVGLTIEPEPQNLVAAANAVGVDPAGNLVRFNLGTPGTIASSTPITGLLAGETILGIDFRPANGRLYGLGSSGQIYTIDPTTAVASSPVVLDTALAGTSFGVDFNPVPDRLRVTSDTGQNLRINVDTGVTITDGAINPGTPTVVGAAYLNPVAGTTSTTLYTIDTAADQLAIQDPPNNGTQAPVGPLGVDASAVLGFDIRPGLNTAFATLVVGGVPGLYGIDLTTGAATFLGNLAGTTVGSLAIVPQATFRLTATTFSGSETAGLAAIAVERIGSDGAVTVTLTPTAGTASTADFDPTPIVVSFADGETGPKVVNVPIVNDGLAEDLETFTVTLSMPTPGGTALGSPIAATVTILDDDLPPSNAFGVVGGTSLARYNTATPGTIVATLPITGLQSGETILGTDFRPVNGRLYGLGSSGRLYTISTGTGAATLASVLVADPTDPSNPFTALSGTSFGVDFNPVPDRLRVTSDTGQNLRINVDAGFVITDGDVNPGTPAVVAVAYLNPFPGATTTTLYTIDATTDQLSIQNPPNDGTQMVVGPLGVDVSTIAGFDIRQSTNAAFATLVVGGTTGLYRIDLTTGAASLIGTVGAAVQSLALPLDESTATLSGTTATFVSGVGTQDYVFDASGGLLRHNRFSAGDAGFASDFDFDSLVPGDQTLSATNSAVAVAVNSGAGDDSVTIGSAIAAASTIAAAFNFNGDGGFDNLAVDDSASATARTIALSTTTVAGLGGTTTFGSLELVTVLAGTGADVVNVQGTTAQTIVNAGDGDDRVAFSAGATLSGGFLDGGGGTNTLDYSGYTTSVAVDLSTTSTLFLARLSGANEPGPLSTSTAGGTGSFLLNTAQTALDFSVAYNGLVGATITGEHFHNAPVGVNGPIVRGLLPAEMNGSLVPNGTASGIWSSTDAQPLTPALVSELLAGRIYFNLHTNLFLAGEIRGQLFAQGTVSPATGTAGVRGFQNATGGSAGDSLIGSSGVNVLAGGGGPDTIVGRQGNDSLLGDGGDDLLVWNNGDGSDLMEGGTGVDTVQVNGSTTGGDAFLIQVSPTDPARLRFDRTNFGLFNLDIGTIEALDFNTLGGDDTTTVEFANGNPIPVNGIDYDGGTGADRLVLQRSSGTFTVANEVYTATGPGDGTIALDGSVITFSSLDPIDDTVPATNFTFNAPTGDTEIAIGNGPTVSGFATTQIASPATPPAFELINFANKTNATINGTEGENSVSVNSATASTGLMTLDINTFGGGDQVLFSAVPAGVDVTADTGAGADVVTVATVATLSLDGGSGVDTLNIDAAGAAVTTGPGTITIGGQTITFVNFEAVNVANALGTPPVAAPPAPTIAAVEGVRLIDVVVARFTDADPGAVAADFVATIAWGDGTTDAGTVIADASNPSVFFVIGSHTYVDDGAFTVTTTVRDTGGTSTTTVGGVTTTITFAPESPPVTFTAAATVGDARIVATGAAVSAAAGQSITPLVATFTTGDPNATVADFTAVIDWGDGTPTSAGTITQVGASPDGIVFRVTGTHTFNSSGVFPITTTITSNGGSVAIASGAATVVGTSLTGTFVPFAATENVAFSGVVANFTDPGGFAGFGAYRATIDWGDGTPQSAGLLNFQIPIDTPGPAGITVSGNHTYDEGGTFNVTVTLFDESGSFTVNGPVTVAQQPIVITGRLAPNSDTGVSNTDNITNDSAPDFLGTSEPQSIVRLTLTPLAGGAPIASVAAQTDFAGNWRINDVGPLADGFYFVTAMAVDSNGVTMATQSLAPILIDTVGPVVANAALIVNPGAIGISFVDALSGLDQFSIRDPGNYAAARLLAPTPSPTFITSIDVAPGFALAGTPQNVFLTLNGGQRIRHARLFASAISGGVQDLAGNALDGEFFGTFPTGNGVPGGDFVARFDFNGRRIFPPQPVGTFAPLAPITPAAAARARRAARLAVARADVALAGAIDQVDVRTAARRARTRRS